jgi:glycosyltransferase involved in cell wall biosynthesis
MSESSKPGSDRVRILFHVPQLTVGGTERHVAALAKGLNSDFYEPVVWCSSELGSVAEDIRSAGIRLVTWTRPTKRHPLAFATTALKIRNLRPDIFHSFDYGAHFADALMAWMVGVGIYISSRRNIRHWDPAQRLRLGERIRNRRSRLVIGNSLAVASVARTVEQVPDSKLRVVYSGVEQVESSSSREQARKQLGVSPGTFVVANVANLKSVKNHALLIRSIKGAIDDGADILLAIAGEGPLRGELGALASNLGIADRVLFLGEISDVGALYAAADAYAHSSLAEGLPTSVIEAMAAGLPVVATRAGGTEDLVVDGFSGILIEQNEAAGVAFTDVFKSWALDRSSASELGHSGARLAAEKYTVEKMIGDYEALYQELIEN